MHVVYLAVAIFAATFGLTYTLQTVVIYWSVLSNNGAMKRMSTFSALGRMAIAALLFFVAAIAFTGV